MVPPSAHTCAQSPSLSLPTASIQRQRLPGGHELGMCMAALDLLLSYTDYPALPITTFKANREQE